MRRTPIGWKKLLRTKRLINKNISRQKQQNKSIFFQLAFKKVVEVDSRDRTSDVQSDKDFKQLMVRDEILEALQQNGYRKPSTVQSQAIPMALLGMGLFAAFLTKLTFFL
jgi:superfamily II DNA/RNA helicase